MVVPGSNLVKRQAEAEGLDHVFQAAGFDWRDPGCSMCVAVNNDVAEPGERCVSTSNRNFENRQGAGVGGRHSSRRAGQARRRRLRIVEPELGQAVKATILTRRFK